MNSETSRRLDELFRSAFPTKSAEAAAFNDIIDEQAGMDAATEVLGHVIENNGYLVGEIIKDPPISRSMTTELWRELVKQHGLIFRAIVDTSFAGLPPAQEVAAKFLEFRKQYTDVSQRDVLLAFLLQDDRVPYPLVPRPESLPQITEAEVEGLSEKVIRDVRVIDFMMRHPSFRDYTSISTVLINTLEGLPEFKLKQTYVMGCLGKIQDYLVSASRVEK
jgi:hypothetical protein